MQRTSKQTESGRKHSFKSVKSFYPLLHVQWEHAHSQQIQVLPKRLGEAIQETVGRATRQSYQPPEIPRQKGAIDGWVMLDCCLSFLNWTSFLARIDEGPMQNTKCLLCLTACTYTNLTRVWSECEKPASESAVATLYLGMAKEFGFCCTEALA